MTHDDRIILVTGATGKQGGATARRLLAEGRQVRALVRDPAASAARKLAEAGAELARGDFDAPDSLAAAVAGVHGVFMVPPAMYRRDGWNEEQEFRRGERLVAAARAAGVRQLVFTGIASAAKSGLAGSEGKHRVEEAVRASGIGYTLLRPVRFMENYLLRDSPVDGIHGGVHRHLFRADAPMKVIALADIAAVAALAFADPERFGGRTLELAGDAITPVAAAAAIGAALGRPIEYARLTLDEATALGPQIAAVWRLWDEGEAWVAEPNEIRALHPGLLGFGDWLAAGGAERIRAAIDD